MLALVKDWDNHVADAEEVARSPGFAALRERILALAAPQAGETVVDIGSGTGLLTLPLAGSAKRVWAIDISASMCEYLRAKSASAGHENVEVAVASATSLPLVDQTADLVVSNYCFHHLDDADKVRALSEIRRVLRDGGRLVFGDMMFRVSISDARDRRVVVSKIRSLLRRGPGGLWRLAKNALRFAGRRWEQPARASWWEQALTEAGFIDVEIEVLDHEGGIARARLE